VSVKLAFKSKPHLRKRPVIAFFDFPDVFEDFYPHYGVNQQAFATTWADTANHAWLALVQKEIGDVIWYVFSLNPALSEARHKIVGCTIKFLPSSLLHRWSWRKFYSINLDWEWRHAHKLFRTYATLASYVAVISLPFIKALWRDRPDMIFVQDYATGRFDMLLFFAGMLNIPLLAFHSGSRPEAYLGRVIKRWTIPRADWLFPSGRNELEMLVNRYRVSRNRLGIIRPPIDPEVFRPLDRTAACRSLNLDPSRRYLLFVGRLDDKVKRVSTIIQTFSHFTEKHPDVDLLIVGEGGDGVRLRCMGETKAPGRVRFLGWISSSETKVAVYNVAECLCLISWREASPAVISEAFACGTPVLASQVGGIEDLVKEGKTGWLVKAGDDEALRGKFEFILENPTALDAMRRTVREVAQREVSSIAVTNALKKGFCAVGVQRD